MQALDLHPEKKLYMKKNIGLADRGLRILAASTMVGMIMLDIIPAGAWAIIAWIFAAASLLTSFISHSPLYAFLGLNSCQQHEAV